MSVNLAKKRREKKKAIKKYGRPMEYANCILVFSDTKMSKKEETRSSIKLRPFEYQCSQCESFDITSYQKGLTNICRRCGRITQSAS